MNRKKINVLSLFDGISVGQLALKELGIPVNKYYTSEVDPTAIKVTNKHFPNTIQLGDITLIDDEVLDNLPPIDLIIFGSPCQDLSGLRKNRQGLDGEQSGLFFDAIRILRKVNSPFYLMENVGSMSKKDRNAITQEMGVKPIAINSSLLTGQQRNRLYWTNIPNVEAPNDAGILFQDIIEHGYVDRDKSLAVLTKHIAETYAGVKRYLDKGLGQIIFSDESYTIQRKKRSTWVMFEDCYGHNQTIDGFEYKNGIRKATITELCRLQGLPDDYLDGIAFTSAHKCIGNSFTCPIIKHILSYANFNN